jgi:hypothetical protein
MATTTRDVLIDIITRGDSTGAQNIGKSLDQVAAKATAAGKTLSLTVTAPLAGLAAVAVKTYAVQEKAERELAAAITATGGAVDDLLPKYKSLASEIQAQTVIGDEQTLGLIAVATQMGVTGDQMDTVVKGAVGLSKAFGIDLSTAARASAAAIQGNTSLLTRYIPQLQAAESDAEKLALAQEKMASGYAQARAEITTTTGSIQQAKNSVGDLMEVIGEQLAPVVVDLAGALKSAAEAGQTLDPTLIKVGVAGAALAASIGPGLIAAGSLIRNYRILQTVAPQTAAAIRAVGSATLSATPIITAAAVAYWGISEAAQAAKTANDNFRESIGLGDTSYVDAILGANSQSELDSAIAQTQVKLDGLSAVIEQQKQQIEDTKGFKFFESGIANTAIRAELEEELALMEKQAQEMAGYIALGNERGAQIVTENATLAETAALIEQERIAAEQKAIADAEAAAQLAAQKAARETLLENLDLEEEILLAKIAGNDELLQSLQDQKREQVIINQLTKTGVSEEAAIARAERLVKLQNQAAEAESKRRKNTSTGNDGNDDLRTRIGLLDQVATKEQSGQQLRDGVRAEQYTDAGGRRKTRYFEGGRLLGDSDQYGHVGDPQPSSAAITPSLSANNPPLASSAQPSSLNNQSSSFSPQSSTLDTTSIEQAITTMHTRLQEQLNNLASRINQLGN